MFFAHYRPGMREFDFDRTELLDAASELGIHTPRNPGDILYSYRYGRRVMPERIREVAECEEWTIPGAGLSRYRFVLRHEVQIRPNPLLATVKIPDATPGIIKRNALTDEQTLLAVVRYNRLIDVFTGVVCYSLQNHLRTTVRGIGQVETDELYVGVDRAGAHYILPVQAKGGTDVLGTVQIEQDLALCAEKYPELICRSIAAQFMSDNVIALFELGVTNGSVRIKEERHYMLVSPDELSAEELAEYRARSTF